MKKYRISRIRDLSSTVKAFTLEPVDEPIEYLPGQFLFLALLDEKDNIIARRPYSIASAPGQPLELCIKLVKGELTGKLERMGIGEIVGIEAGGANFAYNQERKAGFIAGGTGISPMISILRHIAANNIEGEFVLFYSARTEDDILYRKELEELDRNPNIKVVITLTRQDWNGEKGRLCHEKIGKYASSAKEMSWWLCGPLGMIKSMKECLLEMGADPNKIKMEGWG